MFKVLKVAVKAIADGARHFKLEEAKAIRKARTFRVSAAREKGAEATEAQIEDEVRSERYYDLYQNLRHKRTHELRKQARILQLAYGFLRGKSYKDIEEFAYEQPNWDAIGRAAIEFSDTEDSRFWNQKFEQWKQEGVEHWNNSAEADDEVIEAKAA